MLHPAASQMQDDILALDRNQRATHESGREKQTCSSPPFSPSTSCLELGHCTQWQTLEHTDVFLSESPCI